MFSEVCAVLDKNWKEIHHNRLCEILASVEHEYNVEIFFVKGAYQFRGTLSAVRSVADKLGRESASSRNVLPESSGDDAQQDEVSSCDEHTKQVEQAESVPPAASAGHVIGDRLDEPLNSAAGAPLADGRDPVHLAGTGTDEECCHDDSSNKQLDQLEKVASLTGVSVPRPCAASATKSVQPQKDRQPSDRNASTEDDITTATEKGESQQSQQTGANDETESAETENREQEGEKHSRLSGRDLIYERESESILSTSASDHVASDESANPLHSASDVPLSDDCDSVYPETDTKRYDDVGKPLDDRDNTTATQPGLSPPSPNASERSLQTTEHCQASDKSTNDEDDAVNASEKHDSQRPLQNGSDDDELGCTEIEKQEQGGENASYQRLARSVETSACHYAEESAAQSGSSGTVTALHVDTPAESKDTDSDNENKAVTDRKELKDLIYARDSAYSSAGR